MRRALIFAFSILALPVVQAASPHTFFARYTADWKQLPMSGSAERSLIKNDNGTWDLSFKASMMIASLTESSVLLFDKDALQPNSYKFERGGLGKAKKISLYFDHSANKVTGFENKDPVSVTFEEGMLDRSTYQLALQLDISAGKESMSYRVVEGTNVETYVFRVIGYEKVQTKVGGIDSIKVERVRDPSQSKRITQMWFAKDWGGILLALLQVENDGKQYKIMLLDGTVDGKAINGA